MAVALFVTAKTAVLPVIVATLSMLGAVIVGPYPNIIAMAIDLPMVATD